MTGLAEMFPMCSLTLVEPLHSSLDSRKARKKKLYRANYFQSTRSAMWRLRWWKIKSLLSKWYCLESRESGTTCNEQRKLRLQWNSCILNSQATNNMGRERKQKRNIYYPKRTLKLLQTVKQLRESHIRIWRFLMPMRPPLKNIDTISC